jgi:hypothetical protein
MTEISMTEIWPPMWPVLAFVTVTAVALALRAALLVGLRWWPGGGPSVVRDAVRGPSLLWSVALGLLAANHVALEAILLPARWHARVEMLLEAVLVLSVAVMLVSMAGRAVDLVRESRPGRVRAQPARSGRSITTRARGMRRG